MDLCGRETKDNGGFGPGYSLLDAAFKQDLKSEVKGCW